MKKNLNILIVDDSDMVAMRVWNLLSETAGMAVVGRAASSEEAHKFLKQQRPDVILLDIHLPGESGIEFLRQVKVNHPAILVIMLTNFTDSYFRNHCKELGADYFFDKSHEFDKVPEVLQEQWRKNNGILKTGI